MEGLVRGRYWLKIFWVCILSLEPRVFILYWDLQIIQAVLNAGIPVSPFAAHQNAES